MFLSGNIGSGETGASPFFFSRYAIAVDPSCPITSGILKGSLQLSPLTDPLDNPGFMVSNLLEIISRYSLLGLMPLYNNFLKPYLFTIFGTKRRTIHRKNMEYAKFSQIVLRLKSHDERITKLSRLGVDLIELHDDLSKIITLLIEEVYGKEGLDWFEWFCWESDFGEKDWSKHPSYKVVDGKMVKIKDAGEVSYGATDENGNPICHSILSTWEFLEQNHKRI